MIQGFLLVSLRGGMLLHHVCYHENFGLEKKSQPPDLATFLYLLRTQATGVVDGQPLSSLSIGDINIHFAEWPETGA